MLTKKDLSVAHTAYFCSTGARLALSHPSPSDIYQAASIIGKASAKSIEKALKGSNVAIMQAIQTIPWLNNAPWFNGNMSNISLNPYNANLGNLAYEHGLIQQNQTATINPLAVSYLSEHFQYRIQTIEFTKSLIEWSKPFEDSKQELDTIFRNIERSSSGFELQEFCLNYDTDQNNTIYLNELEKFISNELKTQLSQIEPDKCLAILLKKEPCLNKRMNLRYIVILQKDYIDEPSGFTDLSFFQRIKNTVESNSCYYFNYDPGCLNGFLANNRFSKKNPNYRERIRCLKSYLIGTDALYRVDGLQTSLEILYSKFVK